jgi:hypothetical protein
MYYIYKVSNIFCFVMAAYYVFQNNTTKATYFAVMGFYSDWLAEKEK